jgi:predicted RNA binding protein YcfA (HicA-like mRNA interferase family)
LVLDVAAGKGDHATVYLDGRRTVVPDMRSEIPRGTFHNMCRQLGIDSREL